MIRIFHPTDFSPASDVAFVHALKLALTGSRSLTLFPFAHRRMRRTTRGKAKSVIVDLLHVGTTDSMPKLKVPQAAGVTWNTQPGSAAS